jgi:predicted  nucleic acid-binding Zn ribbon protein
MLTCDSCGIDEIEAKKYPVGTGINHYLYRYSTSFYTSENYIKCARCHKEAQLALVIKAIERADYAIH